MVDAPKRFPPILSLNPTLRITAVISSMQAGGAERVMSQLLKHWVERGWEVTVLTFEPKGAESFYTLDPRVHYRPLALAGISQGLLTALGSNLKRLKTLRATIRQCRPHVVLSFCAETNVATLLATRGLGLRVVVAERVDPSSHQIGKVWNWGRRWLYPKASAIVVQSREMAGFFHFIPEDRLAVIPNPVALPATEAPFGMRQKRILAVGRLTPQKGFDLLLKAFAQCWPANPDWGLRIVGEGGERAALLALATGLGVAQALELPGINKDIGREYAEASIFVLSSRYEGFPNALCEAMASGLPVVAFRCSGAVSDIITDGKTGLLADVGDVRGMAARIEKLMDSSGMRASLGVSAAEISERYTPAKVLDQWAEVLSAKDEISS